MKRLRTWGLLFLTVSLIIGILFSGSWAQDERYKHDPTVDEWNLLDTFVARPFGIAAGIIGTGFFIASLPFTVPTGSVNEAAEILIVEPFKFSFKRKFNDPDIYPN